jgi:hypothetical protein
MRKILLGLLGAMICCEVAFGQDATDVVMKAGYCLAVARYAVESHKTQLCAPHATDGLPTALAQRIKQTCRTEESNWERLRDYLLARNMPDEAMIANARGEADMRECLQTAQTEPYASCGRKCEGQKDFSSCFSTCPVPESCQRVRRCNDLSFLPF